MPLTTADTPIADLARSWTRYLRAEGLSDATRRNYLVTLRQLSAYLAENGLPDTPAAITDEEITDFLLDTAERTSASNAGFHYRNLRALYKWLTSGKERAIRRSENPMLDVAKPKTTPPPRPAFTDGELAALLGACRGTGFLARRDEAILRVLMTGLRIGGTAGLMYHPDQSSLDNPGRNDLFLDHQPPLLRLRQKGGRVHLVPLLPKAVLAIDRYLRVRVGHTHAGDGHLWLGQAGALGAMGIHHMLKRRARQAGITSRVHAHRFRRTAAVNLLDAGVDRPHVAELLGWSSLAMVGLYASDTEQQRAWDALARSGIDSRV